MSAALKAHVSFVACLVATLWTTAATLAQTPASTLAARPDPDDNPEVAVIVLVVGRCEACPDQKPELHAPLKIAAHLHATDNVRCSGKSYATGRYISTGKVTYFAGSNWLPVGFPAENDPSLSPNEPPGRTSNDSIGEAKSAALAYLGEADKQKTYASSRLLGQQVRRALSRSSGLDVADVTVRAKNGKVRLNGTVSEPAQSKRAEEVVRAVSGVTSVENKLVIRAEGTGKHAPAGTAGASGNGGQRQ